MVCYWGDARLLHCTDTYLRQQLRNPVMLVVDRILDMCINVHLLHLNGIVNRLSMQTMTSGFISLFVFM
jgi:hypothetical protein